MPRTVLGSLPARALLLACVLALGFILLQPSASLASSTVHRSAAFLDDLGAPSALTAPARVEALLNAAMFVPLGLAAVLALPRSRWTGVVVAGFGGSLAVELFQGLFLPARTCQAIDVVTNTAGTLLGAALGAALQTAARRRAARS